MGPVRAGRAPYTTASRAYARQGSGNRTDEESVPISANWPLRRVDSLLLRAGGGDMCRAVVVGQGVMQRAVSVP